MAQIVFLFYGFPLISAPLIRAGADTNTLDACDDLMLKAVTGTVFIRCRYLTCIATLHPDDTHLGTVPETRRDCAMEKVHERPKVRPRIDCGISTGLCLSPLL